MNVDKANGEFFKYTATLKLDFYGDEFALERLKKELEQTEITLDKFQWEKHPIDIYVEKEDTYARPVPEVVDTRSASPDEEAEEAEPSRRVETPYSHRQRKNR